MTDGYRSATALDKRIGQRIRARRLELGVSQESLAEALGLTFQQVQKYEKGTNRVAASRLHDIAVALSISVLHFFDDPGGKGVSPIDDALATPDGARLMTSFASIRSKRVRRQIVELAEALADEATTKGRG